MKKYFLHFVASLALVMAMSLSSAILMAQKSAAPESIKSTPPATAAEIMKAAQQRALAEHKNVLIIFHASWCGWCKRMDAAINDESCKEYFNKNFVISHLTVLETGSNVALENSGARKMLEEYGGAESGIPYWLIFSSEGKLLADCNYHSADKSDPREGQNIGCPARPEEVDYFIGLLKQHSQMSDEEAKAVRSSFLKNANM